MWEPWVSSQEEACRIQANRLGQKSKDAFALQSPGHCRCSEDIDTDDRDKANHSKENIETDKVNGSKININV